MVWLFIGHISSILLSLIRVSRLSENDKDLEIIILRHQLDVMVRKHKQPVRPNQAEKATLALLTAQLKKNTQRTIRQLGDVIRIVRPETVMRWHRELVRPKGNNCTISAHLSSMLSLNQHLSVGINNDITREAGVRCTFVTQTPCKLTIFGLVFFGGSAKIPEMRS